MSIMLQTSIVVATYVTTVTIYQQWRVWLRFDVTSTDHRLALVHVLNDSSNEHRDDTWLATDSMLPIHSAYW